MTTSVEATATSILADPQLRISDDGGGHLLLEWTTALPDWNLQESTDFTPGSWVDSTLTPIISGDHHQVTITPTNERGFYRLSSEPVPTAP